MAPRLPRFALRGAPISIAPGVLVVPRTGLDVAGLSVLLHEHKQEREWLGTMVLMSAKRYHFEPLSDRECRMGLQPGFFR